VPGPQRPDAGDVEYGHPQTGRHRPVEAEAPGYREPAQPHPAAPDPYAGRGYDTAESGPATGGFAVADPYRQSSGAHGGDSYAETPGYAAAYAEDPVETPGYVDDSAYAGAEAYAEDDAYDAESLDDTEGFDDDADYADEYDADEYDVDEYEDEDRDAGEGEGSAPRTGPFDYDEVAEILAEISDQHLDLGSVLLPVPDGGQLQVEMTPDGTPQAVHLATPHGRLTVAAYAAPKSPGQWRTVAADLAESLRADGAQVSVQTGPWGRELHAVTEGADLRFIGVDGYRWMVRLVAAGPSGAADEGGPLVEAARAILAETVVRRGDEPMPVREPLPVVLPQELADQLIAAHQQQVEAQQQALAAQAAAAEAAATGTFPVVTAEQQGPRRGAEGSAMQQLGLN
jgi:hypothetical protein